MRTADSKALTRVSGPVLVFTLLWSGSQQAQADPGTEAQADQIVVEVEDHDRLDPALKQEREAQALQSVSLSKARTQSSDLGRALARSKGLSFQQSAGLGSRTRLLLAGYGGPQVRYFFDGLPLDWSGYARRISAVSADHLERIDIYEGVVPVQLGTDALGGALHLIGRPVRKGTHGALSYELGSFGNHRAQLQASHRQGKHELRLVANYDHAQNRYPMKIEVANEKGQLEPKTIHRFHDTYRALGARLSWRYQTRRAELGLIAFGQGLDKELQSNLVMSVPFGDARFDRQRWGGVARAKVQASRTLAASIDLGLRHMRVRLKDLGTCSYDWYGRCVRDTGIQGEISNKASDQRIRELGLLARPKLVYRPFDQHTFTLASTLTHMRRTGEDKALIEGQIDPLKTPRTLFSTSTGLAWSSSFLDKRLRNELFAKLHTQSSFAVEYNVAKDRIVYKNDQQAFGWGNAARFEILRGWQLKGSYAWSTRMPSVDERFGNGVLILPNLKLTPERSHNFNLSTSFRRSFASVGHLHLGLRGYQRAGESLILLLGAPSDLKYRNMLGSRVRGIQSNLAYLSPKEHIGVSTHWIFQRAENRSRDGEFKDYFGDRIPNQPYRWGHAQVSLGWPGLLLAQDRISGFFGLRWVGQFMRTWESLGVAQTKQFVPEQTSLSAGVTYRVANQGRSIYLTVRVDNLANAQLFDFFGVPKPGRAFASKVHLEF